MRVAAFALLLGLSKAQDFKLIVDSKTPDYNIGMFWMGNAVGEGGVVLPEEGTETFVDAVAPKAKIAHQAKYGDRFIFRGPMGKDNGGFRCAVQIQKGMQKDGVDFPYSISFQAVGTEPAAGHLELQHGGSSADHKPEYLWINRGQQVAHLTEGKQEFVIRNSDRQPIVAFTLAEMKNEL